MTKIFSFLFAGVMALTLTGCSSLLTTANQNVPHTTFKGTIGGQSFEWENPKDTTISNFVVTVNTNGSVSMNIGSIVTQQDTNAIAEAAQIVEQQGIANVNLLNAAAQAGATIAAKGAATAAK
jgi:hypothetical protein